jgi:hypothetical protein
VILLSLAQTAPEGHNLARLLQQTLLKVLDRSFSNFGNVLGKMYVGYGRDLTESLQRIELDLLVVNDHCAEDTIHDEVALVLVLEVQACRRDGPLESLDGDTGQFDLLVVALVLTDVADH